jgi:hypothetical protein
MFGRGLQQDRTSLAGLEVLTKISDRPAGSRAGLSPERLGGYG